MTKGQVFILLGATALAGWGLYHVMKPPAVHDNSSDADQDKANNKAGSSAPSGGTNFKVDVPASSSAKSKYGFNIGDKIYLKNEKLMLYSYPQVADKYVITLADRSLANGKFTFAGDSSVIGWIKIKSSGKEVFVLAQQVTNVAP